MLIHPRATWVEDGTTTPAPPCKGGEPDESHLDSHCSMSQRIGVAFTMTPKNRPVASKGETIVIELSKKASTIIPCSSILKWSDPDSWIRVSFHHLKSTE